MTEDIIKTKVLRLDNGPNKAMKEIKYKKINSGYLPKYLKS